ncbi:uncharacterized protein EDB91DRAFT_1255617 [Suillus paluster]|uniref:uncharacterized protein n=1 Tax=Suillus paluster TaxID=48578 RepID=UPI001B86BBBF|nr:uncharacterized protein EDB91DRAFT_1255617 [Suillus paluster]KAG1723466.1 hypothetical protein EDB91DRAFT_1255617 [Suillus paluster]
MARKEGEDEQNQVQRKPRGTRPSIDRFPLGVGRPDTSHVASRAAPVDPPFPLQSKQQSKQCSSIFDLFTQPPASRAAPVDPPFPLQSKQQKRQLTPELEPTKQAAKRARTETHVPRNHERFWLPDGNCILEFDSIRFRVHQSWLAQHSKNIAGLLAKKGIKLEVITLEPSECRFNLKAVDFEALLLLYENPGNYRNTIEPLILMSLIRAASWLGFDSDFEWLVKELEAFWPSNLKELSANPVPRRDASEVVALARMCNIDGLLKPAFYDMARTPGFGLNELKEPEQISHADMLRLVVVREDPHLVCQNLRGALSGNAKGTSGLSENTDKKPPLGSTSPASVASKCLLETVRREAWIRLVYDSDIFTLYQHDPLCGLEALINLQWTNEWCRDCKDAMRADWRTVQKSIWEKIDEYLKED